MDHPLHGAQVLLPHRITIGAPEGYDAPLSITFEVRPLLHDLTHLWENRSSFKVFYCDDSHLYRLLLLQPLLMLQPSAETIRELVNEQIINFQLFWFDINHLSSINNKYTSYHSKLIIWLAKWWTDEIKLILLEVLIIHPLQPPKRHHEMVNRKTYFCFTSKWVNKLLK